MRDLLNEYRDVKKCVYKGETYFVRDNGAVMRVPKDENKPRPYDNIWTFGKASDKIGYMDIAGQMVHRIVAFAFHGEPPTEYHVVDHIDTNRRNNRPENLRWVTRLENVLENPITSARIVYVCGSIEAFLKNPSMLKGHESEDSNFSWMKTVSKEEAQYMLARLTERAKNPTKSREMDLDERIFQDAPNSDVNPTIGESTKPSDELDDWKEIQQNGISLLTNGNKSNHNTITVEKEEQLRPLEIQSLTPNAIQLDWKYPVLFPCCPQQFSENPLNTYQSKLGVDAVFCKNDYYSSLVVESAITDEGQSLWVLTRSSEMDAMKPWKLAKITYENGIFCHNNEGSYCEERGARKYFTLVQGKEWTGGDVMDDYC